jgi:catechol-2,3-dioxygenase
LVGGAEASSQDQETIGSCDHEATAFIVERLGCNDPLPRSSDPYERHLALRVDDKENVDQFAKRATSLGIDNFIVDHDDFYSLYLLDPDGEQVEVTWHKPSFDNIINSDEAHRILTNWLSKARGQEV